MDQNISDSPSSSSVNTQSSLESRLAPPIDNSPVSSIQNNSLPTDDIIISPIQKLPAELIAYLFSFLNDKESQYTTLLVCKLWFSSTVESLWFRPNITNQLTLVYLLRTIQTPLEELTLNYPSLIKRINLISILSHVNDDMLLKLLPCRNLERLTLTGCSKLTDRSLVPLLRNNKSILSVDMTNLDQVTSATLTKLAQNCPKLQGLYASGCKNITDDAVNVLADRCPSLKRVKFNGCFFLSDFSIKNIIQKCPLLVEFDVSGCNHVTDDVTSLAYIHLSQLREYRVSYNTNISDMTLLSLQPNIIFDKLRIMDFSGCPMFTDDGVSRLVQIAPKLRNVVLAKCYHITDRALLHLSKLGRNLHYIHLGHCNSITDFGVSTLVKACMRIQYIDVACCNQLHDSSIKDIAALPRLRRVGLVKCQSITDEGIAAFSDRPASDNSIERIHLSYCNQISLQAVTALVKNCGRLTHLSLTGVPAFMRQDLTRFSRDPPPEFTQHQQQLFCVYSGQGVKKLRRYLIILEAERRRVATSLLVENSELVGNWNDIPEVQMLNYVDDIAQPLDDSNPQINNNDAAREPDDVLEEVRNAWNTNNELANDPNFQVRFISLLQAELELAANAANIPQPPDAINTELGDPDGMVRQPLRRGNFGPVIANRIRFLNGLEQQARQGITIGVNQVENSTIGQQDQESLQSRHGDRSEPPLDRPH